MIRALLFDFNGVLVDTEPIHFELYQRILAEEGVELSLEQYNASCRGHGDHRGFAAVLESVGRDTTPMTLSRLIARKAAYYQQRIRQQGFPLFPGAAELIRSAIDEGLMLGVVSGALRDEVEGVLGQLGAREHFKVVVTADDVDESKPDSEGYRRGLELLNALPPLPLRLLHPHEVLAIEDAPSGLAAAAANGLQTLGVAQTRPAEALSAADHVEASLDKVSLSRIHEIFG